MKPIKYSFCVGENGELVHIKDITDETRHAQRLYCLQCGQEMVANLCKRKRDYFSHKAETACDGESYLHKLAKIRIKEKFDTSDHFPITFVRDVPCSKSSSCPCCDKNECTTQEVEIKSDLKCLKGKPIYDKCEVEATRGDFRPDLMLTCSSKPDREPVFIEIYKTHQSSDEKLQTNKVIETTKIQSEEDIESIIQRGFVEGENCELHNFKPRLPLIQKKDVPIDRFILFSKGAATIYRATDYLVKCEDIDKQINLKSIAELNLKHRGKNIWGTSEWNDYQLCLAYLTKKGMNIRNCILCKNNKYYGYNFNNICVKYKELGLRYATPPQTKAWNCQSFEPNPKLMSIPLSELEKNISDVFIQQQ